MPAILLVQTLLLDLLEEEDPMFTRILVPMDFSPPSDAALEYAQTLAFRFGASLDLLHVAADPYRSTYATEVYVPEQEGLKDAILNDAAGRLKDRMPPLDAGDVAATAHALFGMPTSTIVEYAEGHDIDLIVMGTHGRGGMSHLLMGSVAERVVRTAPCPVLTVHGRARKARRAA